MTMRLDPAGDGGTIAGAGSVSGTIGGRSTFVAAEEFHRLPEVLTLYHAKRALRRITETNGFEAFALLNLKSGTSLVVPEMVTSSWACDPSDALRSLAEIKPDLRAHLVDDVVPFHIAADDAALLSMPGADILGLPVFSERGRGALLLASPGPSRTGAHTELHLYTLYLFARIAALTKPRASAASLAPREIECLRWSAAGKTSCEIAGILGVSENTVNSYLSAAAQKMNAVNRVQTVAQAIRFGLLS